MTPMQTQYLPGSVSTITQAAAPPAPAVAGPTSSAKLLDSFIQRRLRQPAQPAQSAQPARSRTARTTRARDMSRNQPDGGHGIAPAYEEPWWYAQNAAMEPVTGFNMGGGYTINPNKLPPWMRPQQAGVIPGTNVPTGSIQSPDMEYAAESARTTGDPRAIDARQLPPSRQPYY